MRITIVIGAFLSMPPAPAGAIEKVWAGLAREFAKRGHAVTVICPAYGSLPAQETIDGVDYRRHSGFDRTGSQYWDLWRDFRYAAAIRKRLPDADVTLFNCFWLPRLVVGRAELGILDFHLQRFPKRQLFLYRRLDRISTVSAVIAENARKQTPSVASLLDVIPNPVDTDLFYPGAQTSDNNHRVLFHGRIHPEKGLHLLLNAARLLKQRGDAIDLSIIGPHRSEHGGGGEAYFESLKQHAADLDVHFEPPIVEAEALADRLRQCAIHCYPSVALHGEASPVAPIEAMACGAVPVVSDLPQFDAYVHPGVTGLMFERQASDAVEQLAAALQELLANDQRRAMLRKNAIAMAQTCSMAAIADQHLAAWEQLIEART